MEQAAPSGPRGVSVLGRDPPFPSPRPCPLPLGSGSREVCRRAAVCRPASPPPRAVHVHMDFKHLSCIFFLIESREKLQQSP